MDHLTERSLIEKTLTGDPSAFRQIVEKYKLMVINTCNGFLHDRQDAEDTAQEVFTEAFLSLSGFRNEAKISTWLYRIAVNKSLNVLRSRKRKQWLVKLEDVLGMSKQTTSLEDHHPGSIMEAKEQADILHKAINSLPENQRIAFTLHKFDDMPYTEIAEVMNLTLSSVESLIHRAKINLQKKLLHYYNSDNK
jgi:RNA polymerase sigma-70 factor, ECF subfamily